MPTATDVPAPCAICKRTTLHRPDAAGALHCLKCLSADSGFGFTNDEPVPVRVVPAKTRSGFGGWPVWAVGGGIVVFVLIAGAVNDSDKKPGASNRSLSNGTRLAPPEGGATEAQFTDYAAKVTYAVEQVRGTAGIDGRMSMVIKTDICREMKPTFERGAVSAPPLGVRVQCRALTGDEVWTFDRR